METPFTPKTVAIYSMGLLGTSIALGLKASGFSGTIIGLSSPSSIAQASALSALDEGYGYEALPDICLRADILILCSPICAIIETLQKIGSCNCKEGLLVTDIGSTKREIMQAAQKALPAHVHFIGGHPMAGSEKQGALHGDPYLYQNAVWALIADAPLQNIAHDLGTFLHTHLGCRCVMLDAVKHDTIAATISHVPHILATALMTLAATADAKVPGTLDLAAGGFRDMTRIASSPYGMWHDILITNKDLTGQILNEYISILTLAQQKLQADDLGDLFNAAAIARKAIPAKNKGYLSQLSEILVLVKDQPGIIAGMANILAAVSININDIEVVKVREGEGGTIRMAFATSEIAQNAVSVLRAAGFDARERQ